MAIIAFAKTTYDETYSALNLYPDQYVSDEKKKSNDWIKETVDYFYTVALQQYSHNKETFYRNYAIYKGDLCRSDFYGKPEIKSFVDTQLENEDLPSYVKPYNILTPPINTLLGELTKRPDNVYVKAFDEDSVTEERQYREDIMEQLAVSAIQRMITAQSNGELSDEDLAAMTEQKAAELLSNYTTTAEKWGSKILEFMKVRFHIKDKSEDAFRDLLISAREFYLVYEDNSQIGFNTKVLNPVNTWALGPQDIKYTTDPLDKGVGIYAGGTIEVMELSQILHEFTLTKEEVDHLRKQSQEGYLIPNVRSSFNSNKFGVDSVEYNVYNRGLLEERLLAESDIFSEKSDEIANMVGLTSNVGLFGNKFLVLRAYWCSKKKVGQLTFIDENGDEQKIPVDENYKKGTHPQEISLEWGYVNQWYQAFKIGNDIYYCKPFNLLDYCPIIGGYYEVKNLRKPVSLVDQMKHFYMLYVVAMNKLFRLTEKDKGKVFLTSLRHIPVPKDAAYEDALDMWEAEAQERGVIFIDDSPENSKIPSNFNQYSVHDLSRSQEIQGYYELAVAMRNECWKLVGLSEQRLGESKATETATGINTALTQSYAQTEPWFAQHEYILNRLYQALLDAALYIFSRKPGTVIPFITDEGERAFIESNGLSPLTELGVLVTNRQQDAQNYQELKMLAQAMLQNGARPLEIAEMYSTKSMGKIKDTFRKLQEKQDEFQERQQQIEQQKIEQSQQQAAQANELAQLQLEKQQAFEGYQKEQDRLSKEKIAYIQAASKESAGTIGSTDLDYARFDNESIKIQNDYRLKIADLTSKQQQILSQNMQSAQKMQLEKEKLKVARENQSNDLEIERLRLKAARAKNNKK